MIDAVSHASRDAGEELCGKLDLQVLARRLNGGRSLLCTARVIRAVSHGSRARGEELCGKLDLEVLARRINRGGLFVSPNFMIVKGGDPSVRATRELCGKIDLFAGPPAETRDLDVNAVAELLMSVYTAKTGRGEDLVGLLELPGLAGQLSVVPLGDSEALVRCLKSINPEKAYELVSLVPDRRIREHLQRFLAEGDT
jgi:hypothetical protein